MSLDSILRATGKNLFDISNVVGYQTMMGLTYQSTYGSISEDQIITCRYSAYGQSLVLKDWSRYLATGTYTISADCYYPTTTNATKYQIVSCLHLKNGIDKLSNIYRTITPDTWTRLSFTVAIISGGNYYLLLQPVGEAGAYLNLNVQFKNIQIEKGSTATTYEPFHRILQSVKMPSNGENLTPYPYADSDKTANGITFVTGYYSGITINGATDLPVGYIVVDNLDLTAGNYTFSSGCNSATIPNGVMIQLCYLENGSVKGLTSQLSGSKLQETFSIDDTIAQKKFRVVIVLNQDVSDSFSVNDLVFLPTLVKSENREVLKVSYNSRNLLPYPYFHSSMLQAGITYTVNSDGTITANGTATGRSEFVLSANKTDWANGNYILSGCPSGGSQATYSIITVNGFSDIGSGITVPQSELTRISIIIKQGTTVDNLVFKPQLELGDTKTDYVPYYHETVWIKEEIVATNKLGSFKLGESVLA